MRPFKVLCLLMAILLAGTAAWASETGEAKGETIERETCISTGPRACLPAEMQVGYDLAVLEWVTAVWEHDQVVWIQAITPPFDLELWLRIGRCEQPGDGYAGINWTAQGTFGNGLQGGGGLGMSNGAWAENGGLAYAPVPSGATPNQQMTVAQRVRDRYGPGAWGCK